MRSALVRCWQGLGDNVYLNIRSDGTAYQRQYLVKFNVYRFLTEWKNDALLCRLVFEGLAARFTGVIIRPRPLASVPGFTVDWAVPKPTPGKGPSSSSPSSVGAKRKNSE